MRALEYIKKRFEFSLLSKRPIYLNQNDIDALNQIIEFVNGKPKNEHLEDALLLFYILQHWKVENINNNTLKMRENKCGVFEITGADLLLKKLSLLVNPKKEIYNEIFTELRIHQAQNNIPKTERIKLKDVTELLEGVIKIAKTDFSIIKDLDKYEVKYVYTTVKH